MFHADDCVQPEEGVRADAHMELKNAGLELAS